MKKYLLALATIVSFNMHHTFTAVIARNHIPSKRVAISDIGIPKYFEAKVDCGSITVRSADQGFSCNYVGHNTDLDKTIKIKKQNGKFEVEFKKEKTLQSFSDADHPRVDFELVLPKNCEIKINLGKGNIDVASVNGEIKIHAGSGAIKTHTVGKSQIKLGNGKIEVQDAPSKLDINIGKGDVVVSYADSSAIRKTQQCTIKGGNMEAIVKIPSSFCVLSNMRGVAPASKISNDFEPCNKRIADIIINGSIGTGAVHIKKK